MADTERIQWRHNNGYDSILLIDDEGSVCGFWDAGSKNTDAETYPLRDMLVDLGDLNDWRLGGFTSRSPGDYGDLVMSRRRSGEVTDLDPELFKKRLAFFFRGA